MNEQNHPEREHPRRKKSEPLKPVLIFFVLLVLLAVGGGIYFFYRPATTPEPVLEEPLSSVEEGRSPEPVILETSEEPAGVPVTAPAPDEQDQEELTVTPVESPEERRARECRALAGQIHEFFTHLDSTDYIARFDLQAPSQDYFIALAEKLLQNPPVVSRESDDLYTILKNMAHFFRVIGKDNIILIKTILDRERDKIEDVAAEFYQWTDWENCDDERLRFSPSLAEMYEYAGFFLNTMGGRSYLFRRDSRSRLLVNYYSVLLIEKANRKGINRYGIDITQIIPQLIQEIDSSNQLIYKENYIESLEAVLERYQ
ncbi:MAG: hypothetical protein Kow0089_19740 [Desulfobulbaceae bacterium]